MKKIYLLALGLISVTASAQFTENFDDYAPGDVTPQSPYIIMWPGAPTDGQVSNTQAKSAPNSMWIRNNNSDDVIVQLGNKTTGTWTVSFDLYVPSGGTGFWNIQNDESANPAQWNGQFFVGATGSGGVAGAVTTDLDGGLNTVPYSENTWFNITHVIDLGAGTHVVTVDGNELYNDAYIEGQTGNPAAQIGGVNFYSIDNNNNFYVDDFKLIDGAGSTVDFGANSFRIYPNPVVNVLNISSNEVVEKVAVYNVIGQLVNQVAPKTASPTIDFSTMKSGVYFVEVTINGQSQTVKIVK